MLNKTPLLALGIAVSFLFFTSAPANAAPDVKELFKTHCSECHGVDRLGGIGPALLPENLRRLRLKKAVSVIAKGRDAAQMPGFSEVLSAPQIKALADYIFTPLAQMPVWGAHEIMASRVLTPVKTTTQKPLWDADPMNVFVVVETGDHHITILNGDTFTPMHRFKSRYALHGGPKFTSDGRYVFFGSRDGWITKFDLYTLSVTAEIRAGINLRNIAVSSDNRYVIVANYLPHTLVILNTDDLSLARVIKVESGKTSSRVSAVYNAPPRRSFIVALKDMREVWEIDYSSGAAQNFSIRHIMLDDYLDDFFFSQSYDVLIGTARNARNGQIVNLDMGKKIAQIALPGMPHLGSGITFEYQGRRVMATQHIREAKISIIDMKNWSIIKTIATKGPGFFLRSHENTPYIWGGVFFGPNRDMMHIIDKRTLEIVKTLRPVPGKTLAHVEFTKNGSHALVSLWEKDGALLIYDARTFKEVKRLPMSKPSGKYNVHNKITFSEGTSH